MIAEIRRVASEIGEAPGQRRFENLTGVARSSWYGRYWSSWTEALVDAGLAPNTASDKQETPFLLASLATLTRRLGRFPTYVEVKLEKKGDPAFPRHQNLTARLGHRAEQIEHVRQFAAENAEYSDVLPLLPKATAATHNDDADEELIAGSVYLIKLGKHYKVGHTTSVPRRHRQISLELPEKPDIIHVITTDDPAGIEAYWHNRFGAKRTNGEWFALSIDEVRAFKRRRTM